MSNSTLPEASLSSEKNLPHFPVIPHRELEDALSMISAFPARAAQYALPRIPHQAELSEACIYFGDIRLPAYDPVQPATRITKEPK